MIPNSNPQSPKPKNRGNRWGPSLDWERIRSMYRSGLSSRDVAHLVGCSKTHVAKVCKDILRSKKEAARGTWKEESRHWRTHRQRARKIMERLLGTKLPPEVHVHHINGDWTDHRPENLELMTRWDHAHLHHPANPVPRHQRPERKLYQREYHREYTRNKAKNV